MGRTPDQRNADRVGFQSRTIVEQYKALTKFVKFDFPAREAGKHVRAIRKYGRLVFAWGDWNGLQNAGTVFYKARNRKILAAGLASNGVGKGFPLLKGFWISVGTGKPRARMNKAGELRIEYRDASERRIPFDAELLERATYLDDEAEGLEMVREHAEELTEAAGEFDLLTVANGLGSELTTGEGQHSNPQLFADYVAKLWLNYGKKAGHEFWKWAPQMVARKLRNQGTSADLKAYINSLNENRLRNKSIIKRLKDNMRARDKARKAKGKGKGKGKGTGKV
jgi:hypothetical protein